MAETVLIIIVLLEWCVAIGWIAMLIWGIVSLRMGRRKQGIIVTVIGIVWAVMIVLVFIDSVNKLEGLHEVSFNPSGYGGPKGNIVLRYRGSSTLVIRNFEATKTLRIKSSDGIFSAPVGSYHVLRYEVIAKTKNDMNYSATCYFNGNNETNIQVKANTHTNPDIGPPLIAFIEAEKSNINSIKLTMHVTDSVGNKYRLALAPHPRFVVVDKSGKMIWKGELEDDYADSYVFTGEIPSSAHGDVILRPVLPRMLFKVIVKETRIRL